MIKKIILLIFIILLLCGCTKKNNNYNSVFYLNSKYYNKTEFIKVSSTELDKLSKESFLLFTYNNYCTLKIPCENIFSDFMKEYKVGIVSIKFEDFKNTKYYNDVKYAPSILIIKEGKVIAFLDADSDDDINKYQDVSEFKNWVSKYISLSKE